jgi:hypothetical protein
MYLRHQQIRALYGNLLLGHVVVSEHAEQQVVLEGLLEIHPVPSPCKGTTATTTTALVSVHVSII